MPFVLVEMIGIEDNFVPEIVVILQELYARVGIADIVYFLVSPSQMFAVNNNGHEPELVCKKCIKITNTDTVIPKWIIQLRTISRQIPNIIIYTEIHDKKIAALNGQLL